MQPLLISITSVCSNLSLMTVPYLASLSDITTGLVQTTQQFLSSETQRCAKLSQDLDKQNRKVNELETHLEAGRTAMGSLQSIILGKSGQPFAVMAEDLKISVARFNDEQARLASQAVELKQRTVHVAEREQSVFSREAATRVIEAEQAKKLQDLETRERQVRNHRWKLRGDSACCCLIFRLKDGRRGGGRVSTNFGLLRFVHLRSFGH